MLNSLERRVEEGVHRVDQYRLEALRADTGRAQHAYRACVLKWGSPEHAVYWLIAYARLIEMGNTLTVKLREATLELPPSERYEVSADVEMLEGIVDDWTDSLRAVMAAAVA